MTAFISKCCDRERCQICFEPAAHKIAEEIQFDDPNPDRHPLTSYVCHEHFVNLMGHAARYPGEKTNVEAPAGHPDVLQAGRAS